MDKQIEEMRNDLSNAWHGDIIIGDKFKDVAEKLTRLGYRKIPEGAVVLTRRAYDGKEIIVEMSGGHKLRLTVGKFGEMCKILEEHTRKETTEKFTKQMGEKTAEFLEEKLKHDDFVNGKTALIKFTVAIAKHIANEICKELVDE